MESSQKIATFADISGEINNGKTTYICPIGMDCALLSHIYNSYA